MMHVIVEPRHVKELAVRLAQRFGFHYWSSADRRTLEAAGALLREAGITDALDVYLRSYAFTLGKYVSTPFDLEHPVGIPGWPLEWQVITLAHEAWHTQQVDKYGGEARYMLDYVLSGPVTAKMVARAFYEFEAYRTAIELYGVVYGGAKLDPVLMAEALASYGVPPETRAFVAESLRDVQRIVDEGGIASPTAREVLSYFAEERAAGRLNPPPEGPAVLRPTILPHPVPRSGSL